MCSGVSNNSSHITTDSLSSPMVITTARMGERNALKSPPLLKFEGPLTSKRFHELMTEHTKLFYHCKDDEANKLVSMVTTSSENVEIKLFLSLEHLLCFSSYRIIETVENILQKCQSLNSQNGQFLQAFALVILADTYSHSNDHKKALECIRDSRSLCFSAAPSYITSLIPYVEATTLFQQHEGNITPSIRKKILWLFDHAIDHLDYETGWERCMMYFSHIHKALFCLNGTVYLKLKEILTSTEEDISLAEQHLNAVPVDELSKLPDLKAHYHTALSDMNRLRGETELATQQAKQAKQLYAEIGETRQLQWVYDRLDHLSVPNDPMLIYEEPDI